MDTMADAIFRGEIHYPLWYTQDKPLRMQPKDIERWATERLNPAQIVEASNISELFYAGTEQEVWYFTRDFPNLSPPWPVFWVEMKRPSLIRSKNHGVLRIAHGMPFRVGILFKAFAPHLAWKMVMNGCAPTTLDAARTVVERNLSRFGHGWEEKCRRYGRPEAWEHLTEDEKHLEFQVHDYDALVAAADFERRSAGWTYEISIFHQNDQGEVVGPLAASYAFVDDEGQGICWTRYFPLFLKGKALSYDYLQSLNSQTFPAFLTIGLLHCGNVQRKTNQDCGNVRDAYRRHYGVRPVRYETLDIGSVIGIPHAPKTMDASERTPNIQEQRAAYPCSGARCLCVELRCKAGPMLTQFHDNGEDLSSPRPH